MIKKLAEIAATRIGSTKAKREAVLQVKQTEVAEQQAKVMACQKEFDALVEKEALKVQASVCPSCRSTFGRPLLSVLLYVKIKNKPARGSCPGEKSDETE